MGDALQNLRADIAREDAQIVAHLARRLELVLEVANLKESSALPVMQPGQVATVLARVEMRANEVGLSAAFVRRIYESIIAEACRLEDERIRGAHVPIGQAVVLGGEGVAGRIGRALLERAGYVCRSVDVVAEADADLVADVSEHSDALQVVLDTCDAVVFATPHVVTLAALPLWLPRLRPATLVVDLLSSKSLVATVINTLDADYEAIGINPMFGAALEPLQPPLLCVTYRGGERARQLVTRLRETGCHLFECADAQDHDGVCARWQALTHATVLAFGKAAAALGEDFLVSGRVGPPPFRLLRALLARMLRAGAPATYEEIQFGGPHAADARRELEVAASVLADGDLTAWRGVWTDLAAMVSESELLDGEDQFLRACRAIFDRFDGT